MNRGVGNGMSSVHGCPYPLPLPLPLPLFTLHSPLSTLHSHFVHPQRNLQRLPPPARHAQPYAVAQDNRPATIRLAVQLAHSLEVDDQRAVDAHELAAL